MKCRKTTMLTMIGILTATLTLAGCSSNRVSLAEQGLVSVEKQNSEKVKILWTDVYRQDGQTWVCGVLKQQSSKPSAIKTHVDILISAPDGSKYYEVISEDVYVPRNRVGKGLNWKKFREKLPLELPKDSRISMTVHSGSHEKTDEKS